MDEDGFVAVTPWEGFGDDIVNGVLMQDVHGRLLLQFRDAWPYVVDGGKWSLFGGAIEKDEPLARSCAREVQEELGITLDESTLKPFAKAISNPPEKRRIYVFTCSQTFKVSDIMLGEGAGFAVFNREQLQNIDIVKPIVPVIDLYRKKFMESGAS